MIGRNKEREILRACRDADRSRLVVVYGRRRAGKTFLVREAFDYRFTFTHTGLEKGSFREQLVAFWSELRRQCGSERPLPRNWMEAFEALKDALEESKDVRKTVFLDELPWMDTRNSGFVKAVEWFWNGWASARKDVVLVVCGSAAAWMTRKVLQNRGGLFNRASRTIRLEPFTLAECEAFVRAEGLVMDRKDIASAYMVFGGAPYYWSLLEKGESLSQNVDRLFFAPGAELADEFSRLYRSVFSAPEPHIAVVTALGRKKAGMTREELARAVPGAGNDGTLTDVLRNLETSGFVRRYAETGNVRKGSVYQLIDNYTLFHFRFVQGYSGRDPHRFDGFVEIGRDFLADVLKDAFAWKDEHPDKILWCGEFGTIRHAKLAWREAWMRDVVSLLREHGIPWCVWNYLSTPNDGNRFSLVDDDTRRILSPALLRACLGEP